VNITNARWNFHSGRSTRVLSIKTGAVDKQIIVDQNFQNKALVMAAWLHFLVFDLFGAVWIKKNSLQHGIKHAWILPSLIFTCLFGPLGYLLYLLTRWVKTKEYFSENF
jgi:apolipoprotein N-acyltransferase